MYSGTIPIAYGGLSKSDYLEVVPPHSFIYAEDFPSVQALGEHLLYLSQNETAYNSYFWWKRHYQLSSIVDEQWNTNCDLCEKINQYYSERNPEELSGWNQLYRDFGHYWGPSDICRQPGGGGGHCPLGVVDGQPTAVGCSRRLVSVESMLVDCPSTLVAFQSAVTDFKS